MSIAASLAKPGRRFQIVDATLDAGDPVACLARAVRLGRADMPDAAASSAVVQPLPRPEAPEPWTYFAELGGERFYPDATEIRVIGGAAGCGHAVAWIRLRGDLLPGVAPSPLARVVAAADFSNGLSWILPFDKWLFVNTELTIHRLCMVLRCEGFEDRDVAADGQPSWSPPAARHSPRGCALKAPARPRSTARARASARWRSPAGHRPCVRERHLSLM